MSIEDLVDPYCLYHLSRKYYEAVCDELDDEKQKILPLLRSKLDRIFRYGKFTTVKEFCLQAFRLMPDNETDEEKWKNIDNVFRYIYRYEDALKPYTTLDLFYALEYLWGEMEDDFYHLARVAFKRRDHAMMQFLRDKFDTHCDAETPWLAGLKYCTSIDYDCHPKLSPTRIKCLLWDGKICGYDYIIYVSNRYGNKDMFYKLYANKLTFEFPNLPPTHYEETVLTPKNVWNLWSLIKKTDLSIRNFTGFICAEYKKLGHDFVGDFVAKINPTDKSGILLHCHPDLYDAIRYTDQDMTSALNILVEQRQISYHFGHKDEYPHIEDMLLLEANVDWSVVIKFMTDDIMPAIRQILMHRILFGTGTPYKAISGETLDITWFCDDITNVNEQEIRRINEAYLQGAIIIFNEFEKHFVLLGAPYVDTNKYFDTSGDILTPRTKRYLRRFERKWEYAPVDAYSDVDVVFE